MFAFQDNVCVMKGGLEKIVVYQLNPAVLSLIMIFVSFNVPQENLLILTRFAGRLVQEDTIKTVKSVQNVTCNVLSVMALKQIIVSLANF